MIARLGERQAGAGRESPDHRSSKGLRRVDTRADRSTAQRQLTDSRQRPFESGNRVFDLRGVATELLSERDRSRVHQVCTARLHDTLELALLATQ